MAIDSRYRMSQERLDTLKEELHYLETTREKEVAELIKEARVRPQLRAASEICVGRLALPVCDVIAAAITVGLWRLPVSF